VKIAIIGGGPSGLYLALLLKRHRPDWDVNVVEQNAPDATFGFGVVLADTGLMQMQEADGESYDAICAAMHYNERHKIVQNEVPIEFALNVKGGAIPRLRLLEVLQDQATRAGVGLRFGERINAASDLDALGLGDADVVVGADGINSVIRREFADEFGTTERALNNRFSWYGTKRVFDTPALVFRRHDGGHFVAHYYAYSADMSTFVAECDAATWFRLGLDQRTDTQRQALIEQIFAPELDGASLVSNHSIWRQFPVVRNSQWSHGRYVLIGDALASAHFSIGSGTRIAMMDSIALAGSLLANESDPRAALTLFEREHAADKAKFIIASERSFDWYEDMAQWMDQYSPEEFVYRFMVRTGRVDEERLYQEFPELMQRLDMAPRAAHAPTAGV